MGIDEVVVRSPVPRATESRRCAKRGSQGGLDGSQLIFEADIKPLGEPEAREGT